MRSSLRFNKLAVCRSSVNYPAVTIHGLDQALTVLGCGRPVTLLSAPAAALAGGCLWWRELIRAAREQAGTVSFDDILDCGDAPGRAMAALRVGQMALILDPACPAFAAVHAAAETLGARVLAARPPALDFGPRDLASPYGMARLGRWLARDDFPCG